MKSFLLSVLFFFSLFSSQVWGGSKLASSPPFGIITVPQSGTHLIMKCLGMIQNRENLCLRRAINLRNFNQFDYTQNLNQRLAQIEGLIDTSHYFDEHSHLSRLIAHFMDRHPDFPWIVGVRDLRDTVVSQAHFVWEKLETILGPTTLQEKISYLLDYTNRKNNRALNTPTLYYQAKNILTLFQKKGALVVHFEDLVGAKGGGSDATQRETIQKIAQHIGVKLTEEQLDKVQKDLFGTSVRVASMKEETFRSGKISSWRDAFSKENIEYFDAHYSDLQQALGYK